MTDVERVALAREILANEHLRTAVLAVGSVYVLHYALNEYEHNATFTEHERAAIDDIFDQVAELSERALRAPSYEDAVKLYLDDQKNRWTERGLVADNPYDLVMSAVDSGLFA